MIILHKQMKQFGPGSTLGQLEWFKRFELIFKFEFTTSLGGRLVKINEKPTLTKKAKWGLLISLRHEINPFSISYL